MARLSWRVLDCGNYSISILGERFVTEADGGGGNTIQGLFLSDLHFLCRYLDVEDRWNKKLLGRLYFITSF